MKRRPYRAHVHDSFWFVEFRRTAELLGEGKTFDEIQTLSREQNIYRASSRSRAQDIYLAVRHRIESLDISFLPLFLESDIATQKLFALVASLAYDSLFFDFVYEVVREKMILGKDTLTGADVRAFFRNKQAQNEQVAAYRDSTIGRLGSCYVTQLSAAGILTDRAPDGTRKIDRPTLNPAFENWLKTHGFAIMIPTLTGEGSYEFP